MGDKGEEGSEPSSLLVDAGSQCNMRFSCIHNHKTATANFIYAITIDCRCRGYPPAVASLECRGDSFRVSDPAAPSAA